MIRTYATGQMAVNTYLVSDRDRAVIIDPGDDAQYLSETAVKLNLTLQAVWLTHGHFDHLLAAMELSVAFSLPVYLDPRDTFLVSRMQETAEHFLGRRVVERPPEVAPYPGTLEIGAASAQIIPTPGHTPGSVSLYLPAEKAVFTGDVLFAGGSVGRTDFSYCSETDLAASVGRLLALPPETAVYPGHGPETTVAGERLYHGVQ